MDDLINEALLRVYQRLIGLSWGDGAHHFEAYQGSWDIVAEEFGVEDYHPSVMARAPIHPQHNLAKGDS